MSYALGTAPYLTGLLSFQWAKYFILLWCQLQMVSSCKPALFIHTKEMHRVFLVVTSHHANVYCNRKEFISYRTGKWTWQTWCHVKASLGTLTNFITWYILSSEFGHFRSQRRAQVNHKHKPPMILFFFIFEFFVHSQAIILQMLFLMEGFVTNIKCLASYTWIAGMYM